jgi:hypothetical protein
MEKINRLVDNLQPIRDEPDVPAADADENSSAELPG